MSKIKQGTNPIRTNHFIGIDYGAKMAGTTVVCYHTKEGLSLFQSGKANDADVFIEELVDQLNPSSIFIDAPLSLPKVYTGEGDNYFYRNCDQQLGAMSPMFIGGLTARAMRLTKRLRSKGIECFEVYPAGLQRELLATFTAYKTDLQQTNIEINLLLASEDLQKVHIDNWHQVDSILAWYSGYRYLSKQGKLYGDPNEGIIMI